MPVVKVLGTVKKEGEANERATNTVFNCLAVDDNNPDPYRFFYDSASGSGYMDFWLTEQIPPVLVRMTGPRI